MKISIITVCYNSSNTIEQTIKSVLNQSYSNYEYIIIDGCSTDHTVKIIKEYETVFNGRLKYISEKDNGLYDAMNKGINMSTGDIIGIINSDDIISDKDAFKKISTIFMEKSCDVVYSDLYIMDYETMSKIIRVFIAGKGNYKLGWYPPHPTLYVKKDVYNKYGKYDLSFRIAADYDFMIRIMKNDVNMEYIKEPLVYMRSGGVSTGSLKQYNDSFNDAIRVLKKNNIKHPYIVNTIRTFVIIKQRFLSLFKKI